MSEAQRIVALSRRAQARGEQLCLATVVHVEGSAYRKPGARMLLTSGGERAGTISGGCLEAEVSRKAWWLTANGGRLERYSSYADEDGGMPYGLGCGGTVSLLLEQGEAVTAVVSALAQGAEAQRPSVVVMRLAWEGSGAHGPAGTLAVLTARAETRRDEEDQSPGRAMDTLYLRKFSELEADGAAYELPEEILQAAEDAFRQKRCLFLTDACAELPATGDSPLPAYFVEYLAPAPALTIFGAGDDAQPIAEFAASLGWRVTVADGRAHLARRDRFPGAAEVRVLHYRDPALRAACGLAGAPGAWQPPVPTEENAISGLEPAAAGTTSSTASTSAAASTASTSSATAATVDYNSFLQLLVAELQNQDPTNPADPTQYMSQLASFSAVGQTIQTNTKLDTLLTSSALTQAEETVGRTVTSADGGTTGTVTSVAIGTGGTVTATLSTGKTVVMGSGVTVSS